MENIKKLETAVQKQGNHCPNCLEVIDNNLWKVRQTELEREKRIKRLLDMAWKKVDQKSIEYRYRWINGENNDNPYDGTEFNFRYTMKRDLEDWLDYLSRDYKLDSSYTHDYETKKKRHKEFMEKYPVPQDAFNYFEGQRIRNLMDENLFNTPCINCKLPSLSTQTTYQEKNGIRHKWTIRCVICHQSYPTDFKLDRSLDSDYDDDFRLYELYKWNLSGLKNGLAEVEEEITEKEEKRNQYLNKISVRSRFIDKYENEHKK
jgi:hypothetical protein